jgi:sn-glycerol 3-phosphate transport system substrate-binding protein
MNRMAWRLGWLLACGALAFSGEAGAARKHVPAHRAAVKAPAADAQEVVLRHDLSGQALDALATLALRFNDENKGKAKVLLQGVAGVAAGSALPQMALLDIDDEQEFFSGRPQFKALYKVMAESGERLTTGSFLPLIYDAIDDPSGRMQALPLALSVPVLMWNKAAFTKAGLDPDVVPKTWLEVQALAGKLLDSGDKCPLTSSRFSWIHLENLSLQHGEPIAVPEGRGKLRVVLNRMVDVKHLALLASWQRSLYFHYFGPGREGDQKFLSGQCMMLTGASSLYPSARAAFATGVAPLPYHEDVYGVTPNKVLPDGASLWVLDRQSKGQYKAVALFAKFMLRPDVQKEWVKATGFLPMTPGGLEALKADPQTLPMLPRGRLAERKPGVTREKHGYGLDRLRTILNEEVATVWKNDTPPKEALDAAMMRANGLPAVSRR